MEFNSFPFLFPAFNSRANYNEFSIRTKFKIFFVLKAEPNVAEQ